MKKTSSLALPISAIILSVLGGPCIAAEQDVEEVVVVASKIERPLYRVASQVTQLFRDDLLLQQAHEFGEIARYQASLDSEYAGSRFGSTGVSIRSIGGNRVAMEVDGVPLPQQFAIGAFANASRNLLDPAIIERVEVLRGPASSLYGSDAIGGVIAVTSIDPAQLVPTGARHYLGGGMGYRSMDASQTGYLTYARQSADVGFQLTTSVRKGHELDNHSSAVPVDRTDHSEVSVFAKGAFDLAANVKLRLVADLYDRDASSDLRSVLGYGRQYATTVALYGDDVQQRERLSAEIVHTASAFIDEATLLVYYQDSETSQATADYRASAGTTDRLIERAFQFDQSQRGFEARVRKDISMNRMYNVLVAGIEWQHKQLVESRDGSNTDLVTGAVSKVIPPGEVLPQRDLPKSDVDSLGLYVQNEIQFDRLTLIPALRWDRFDLDASTDALFTDPTRLVDVDDHQLSARLGATWRLGDRATLFAHYAEGFRAPPPEDVNLYLDYSGFVTVRALPNPGLTSEESTNYEVGFRYGGEHLALAMSIYRSAYNNFIESRVSVGVDPDDGALLFQSRNVANARIEGFEIEVDQQMVAFSEALSDWSLGLSYHSARGEDTDTGIPINLVNPPKAVLALNWREFESLSASLRATWFGKQTRIDESAGAFFVPPSASVVDLVGRWSITPTAEVCAGIYNLADKRYWRYGHVRAFEPDDPRVDALARPGRSIAVSIHLGRQD